MAQQQPSTPLQHGSIFGNVAAPLAPPPPPLLAADSTLLATPSSTGLVLAAAAAATPGSAVSSSSSSNNTYVMPSSPAHNGRGPGSGAAATSRPRVTRTLGQRPSCLVNASVTYCGNNQIYAFGGFDQFTDEVYNHVLRLDLASHQWSLVDNYGDIPGVRMGHTASLWQGSKLLVFGGENEHRAHLSDLIIFDLRTAHWTQPAVSGPVPTGRARHAAVLHEDRLFVMGGITGPNNHVLDDICFLDLKTFTWSRSWRFVSRFDHSAHVYRDKIWVFGGLGCDMDKNGEMWWLDLKGVPAFESAPPPGAIVGAGGRHLIAARAQQPQQQAQHQQPQQQQQSAQRFSLAAAAAAAFSGQGHVGASGYAANSRTAQVSASSVLRQNWAAQAPGALTVARFVYGPGVPTQGMGIHFHAWTSGSLLDFTTPSGTAPFKDCSLNSFDLDSFKWQELARGHDVLKSGYRWHYCAMNDDGTRAWLLGCPVDGTSLEAGGNGLDESLSDIMEVDLGKFGFLGNAAASAARPDPRRLPPSLRTLEQPSRGLGADLARLLDQAPETGSGTDFIITALPIGPADDDSPVGPADQSEKSPPIHVHRFILQARWPYFARMINARMQEFHTRKLHITEPYSVVRAFLHYLYTDSILGPALEDTDPDPVHPDPDRAPTPLSDVAGMLLMSNIYHVPHLRLLCVNRLSRELDVEHACIIWHHASLAGEDWLRRRAAAYCMTHWGRIVRTQAFLSLPRVALVELSQEADTEGRVVGGDEVDLVGGMDGGGHLARKESVSSSQATQQLESDDEGMDMN